METKTPTLEEVQEKYKNAKIVIDKEGTKATFELADERGIHFYNGSYWICAEEMNCYIWDDEYGYAEIISYKEETHKTDSIVEGVVNQFKERSKRGIEKYGTTLQENNTDDFLQHLKEELMDAILYIEKLQSMKK